VFESFSVFCFRFHSVFGLQTQSLEILKETQKFILDTLFPISCVSCDYDGIWLCEKCFQKIKLLSFQLCPRCEKIITPNGQLCSLCKKQLFFLDALIVATRYKEGSVSKLVHLFKYNFIEDLQNPLGKLLTQAFSASELVVPNFIVPVPLHKRRLRQRGFNQSKLLADYIGQNLTPGYTIPVNENFLRRTRYTPSQMNIKNYFRRKENMRNVFSAEGGPSCLKNKNVLLVDDVATTGATLFECARILKQNGAKKVFGVVVARQEMT